MTIYQVHEYSGVYEDFQDYIKGTFLHLNNAENYINECIKNETTQRDQYKKCCGCQNDQECFCPEL